MGQSFVLLINRVVVVAVVDVDVVVVIIIIIPSLIYFVFWRMNRTPETLRKFPLLMH